MRRKKLLELPFLHTNLKGRVLYLEYVNEKLVCVSSHTIDKFIETPKNALPFGPGSYDSFYLNVVKGSGDLDVLISEILRIATPGVVLMLKMKEGPQQKKIVENFEDHKFIFDKSISVPSVSRPLGPHTVYSTFNYFLFKELTEAKTVSVVIPMFNNAHSILKALESVEAQTKKVHEVIIVNDGSLDNSAEVVKNYMRTSALDIQLFNQVNSGPSKARNVGITKSTGDLIAFLDADDHWVPNKIESQVQVLNCFPKAGLVSCNRNEEKFPRFLIFGFGTLVRLPTKLHLIKNFCPTPTVIMRREIALKELFDESMRHLEDLDLWIRVSKKHDCYLYNKNFAFTGDGKPNFGHSGLSRNIFLMEMGELKCILKVRKDQFISNFEYLLFSTYSLIKFLRRVVIVLKRR